MKQNRIIIIYVWFLLMAFVGTGCSSSEPVAEETLSEQPAIFPDYLDVTIPANIAPLRFCLETEAEEAVATVSCGPEKLVVGSSEDGFWIPEKGWKRLLETAAGKDLEVKVFVKRQGKWVVYQPFRWHVSADAVDPYLVYRLIEPGYELWNTMGIYQRDLTGFRQTAILTNESTQHNCMNCHSFRSQDPSEMLFHMRAKLGGTYLAGKEGVEKLDTKVNEAIQTLVYPSWHPSGNYVAFSVNQTRQAFHMNHPNRIEVYDLASDVVVYDVRRHEVVTDSLLSASGAFETFPTFSPDGKTLYFCSATARPMPAEFEQVRYSLCAIGFDPEKRSFTNRVDTLFQADNLKKSVSFPRVSPDGRYLVFTAASYGNFSIWHKDADLYLMDLHTRKWTPMTAANSRDVESYHSWSSSGRWLVFSSRRIDGLYTHPYLVHIGADGVCSKPFVVPQESPDFYRRFLYSFNIPELVKGKVEVNRRKVVEAAARPGTPVTLGK